jgi:hypothetical protein
VRWLLKTNLDPSSVRSFPLFFFSFAVSSLFYYRKKRTDKSFIFTRGSWKHSLQRGGEALDPNLRGDRPRRVFQVNKKFINFQILTSALLLIFLSMVESQIRI